MKKDNICRICEKPSGKRIVCENCKKKFPYEASSEGSDAFDRKKIFQKAERRSR